MKYRIAEWAGAGFLVVCCWALFVLATFPHTNEWMRNMRGLLAVSCPVTLIHGRLPNNLYFMIVANAATYALFGLIVEALRKTIVSRNQTSH
jgi:hypothetical protein